MTRLCYIASPIDFNEDRVQGLDRAALYLAAEGFVCFDPSAAFVVPRLAEPNRKINRVNHIALAQSDCVLAFLPERCVSVGVPMEIAKAVNNCGIEVAVVGGKGSWALEHPMIHRFDAWTDACDWLAQNVDPDRFEQRRMRMPVQMNGGVLPSRQYEGDAGFDLYVSETVTVEPASFVDIDCGISIELPPLYWGMITGRSSTLRKRGLLVAQGIIDGGYRGPIYSGVWNLTDQPVTVERGERVAQFIPFHNSAQAMLPVVVDELNPSDRGERGFGSSGS